MQRWRTQPRCELKNERSNPSSSFKGRQFPISEILLCVRWYLACPLSYRDRQEITAERGIKVDASTIYRWVQAYAQEARLAHGKFHATLGHGPIGLVARLAGGTEDDRIIRRGRGMYKGNGHSAVLRRSRFWQGMVSALPAASLHPVSSRTSPHSRHGPCGVQAVSVHLLFASTSDKESKKKSVLQSGHTPWEYLPPYTVLRSGTQVMPTLICSHQPHCKGTETRIVVLTTSPCVLPEVKKAPKYGGHVCGILPASA